MDIKLPINLLIPSALNKLVENPLALKVGQKLDVRVISTLLKSEINTIALKFGNSTINVQSNQPIKLVPGQDLQIQVTKTTPVLEFAIIVSVSDLKRQAIPQDLRLKLITPSNSQQNTESTAEISLPLKQPLPAKIIALTDTKIQLQVFTETDSTRKQQKTADPVLNKTSVMITVDRSQLQILKATTINPSNSANSTSPSTSTTPEFKIGQPVILEISSKGITPAFKISVGPPPNTEEKITELIKQLLPKHESSPVLLNPLIKELPQLLKTSSVPEALKQIAIRLLQNLPARQQLNDSSNLKQAFVDSGPFLEAKISESKKNPELNLDQDFKANLLKLVDSLNKGAANPEKPESQDLDLSTLKNLQQKTENNIAKIILDQLASLPKEDNPKQIWAVEIPFIDRGQADTVNIQIERDKDANQTYETDNWSVMITINPPGLGTIQCKLSYHHETINTHFSSRQPETTELISHHIDHLKYQFEAVGLKPGVINIQDGLQPTQSASQMTKNTLFDEKA